VNQRWGGSLPSLKPGEILGAGRPAPSCSGRNNNIIRRRVVAHDDKYNDVLARLDAIEDRLTRIPARLDRQVGGDTASRSANARIWRDRVLGVNHNRPGAEDRSTPLGARKRRPG
jgi:hypothetical protein